MEIILQEDIDSLGEIGDIVKVKDGYARNFLLPRGSAIMASRRNVRALEHQKRVTALKREKALTSATAVRDKLASMAVTIPARAGEEDKLFGSITNIDIEKALRAQGVTIDRRKIMLREPIKQLGTYPVPVRLGGGLAAEIKITIEREVSE